MTKSICPSQAVSEDVNKLLHQYQQHAEEKIKAYLPHFGASGQLREACEYALLNGGRRFRPALVFMVAKALGNHANVAASALAIEFFHTASLIADDLPCMDDDDERRNKPAVHKVFGEATALLASYALIAAGNACIAACAKDVSNAPFTHPFDGNFLGILALENAAANTGALGTTGGQFLDLYPPNESLQVLRDVIHMKTVSLFEVSFVFGWLFGGGHPNELPLVKKCAGHFGMAFQIADDLGDVHQDAENGRKINTAGVFGIEQARAMFHEEIAGYCQSLALLKINSLELLGLARCLEKLQASCS